VAIRERRVEGKRLAEIRHPARKARDGDLLFNHPFKPIEGFGVCEIDETRIEIRDRHGIELARLIGHEVALAHGLGEEVAAKLALLGDVDEVGVEIAEHAHALGLKIGPEALPIGIMRLVNLPVPPELAGEPAEGDAPPDPILEPEPSDGRPSVTDGLVALARERGAAL